MHASTTGRRDCVLRMLPSTIRETNLFAVLPVCPLAVLVSEACKSRQYLFQLEKPSLITVPIELASVTIATMQSYATITGSEGEYKTYKFVVAWSKCS